QGGQGLAIFDEAGLVDPDRVAAVTFDGVRQLAAQLGARGVRRINAENLAIILPDQKAEALTIIEATLRRGTSNGLRLNGSVEAFGRPISLRGEATLEGADSLVTELGLYVDMPPMPKVESGPLGQIGAATLL